MNFNEKVRLLKIKLNEMKKYFKGLQIILTYKELLQKTKNNTYLKKYKNH